MFFLSGRAYLDLNGLPYVSAKLYVYLTGSTTAQDSYTSASLASANTNPVVAGSDGVFGAIYLANKRYKFVLKTSADVTVETWDPVDAAVEYIQSNGAPYPTDPGLEYHDTGDGHRYRRNSSDNGWIDLGAVDSIGGAATVTQQLAGTSTAVFGTPDSIAALWQRGTDITPSGGSVSLPSTGGKVFNIAAGNFSAISSAQGGREVIFEFAGASVITHNAGSMDLPGNANITTAAGDRGSFVNLAAADASGSNWRCLWFRRDDGSLVTVATQAQMETATNLTFPATPGTVQYHPGVAKFWLKATANSTTINASHNVTSVADTATGRMTVTIATDFSSANWCCQVTAEKVAGAGVNSASVESGGQAAGTVIMECRDAAGNLTDPVSWMCSGHGDQ